MERGIGRSREKSLHHEALRTPGIKPLLAFSRKQMRHKPNLRYTARGRPQNLQRFSWRVLNFGFRFAFAILDLLATVLVRAHGQKGNRIDGDRRSSGIRFLRGRFERHAEHLEQVTSFVVGRCRRHDRDVHALGLGKFVGVQLRKYQLFI